ncbi:MAG: antitoxin Xre/MbcA/ParS toxin-binding domain-containing protein [Gemmataceae bacterium]
MSDSFQLREALARLIPQDRLENWLRAPNPAFEGQSPIELIERGESERIWRMIVQIEAGVAS